MTPQSVRVLGSAQHLLESKQTGRNYYISVALPLGYAKAAGEGWPFNRTPESWPVVYVLDGNQYFGLVTDIIRPMAWCGETTDAIVVGIGYPEADDPIETFREYFTRRNADLTPVRDAEEEERMERQNKRPTPSGDAGNFLKFLQSELVPFVEQSYRADPAKRILAGHSYGGLFGAFALLEAPGFFHSLIMGSPTLSYGNRDTFQREESYAQQRTRLPANVYLYVSAREEALDDTTLTDTLRFAAILQGRRYEELVVTKHIFQEQNHCGVVAPGFQWGLQYALQI